MVFVVLAVGRAGQAAKWQINAGGTELSFIVPVRVEFSDHRAAARRGKHKFGNAIDLGIATPAVLQMEFARSAEQHRDQSVPNRIETLLISCEPRDRSDRARPPDESVGETIAAVIRQVFRPPCRYRQPGEIVVCERRMTGVRVHYDFFMRSPGYYRFAQSQEAVL